MSNSPTFDPSIPVLTEVFKDEPEKPGSGSADLTPVPDVEAELEAQAIDQWSDSHWQILERRLSERILHQLQGRVDFVLEQRLRDSMAEALQQAMAGLTEEIRGSLQQTIEKIVVRAVAQELAHLQTLKK
jgi:hypothetical protein